MGELLALLTALLHAIGVVLYKRSIAFVSPFGLNLFKNCVALVFCVSTAVFLGTTKFLSISPTDLALMLVREAASGQPLVSKYSAAGRDALLSREFDRGAISAKGLKYEQLDQLTTEVLLGVR